MLHQTHEIFVTGKEGKGDDAETGRAKISGRRTDQMSHKDRESASRKKARPGGL